MKAIAVGPFEHHEEGVGACLLGRAPGDHAILRLGAGDNGDINRVDTCAD